jgi:predicted dehydrogenase
MPPLVDRVLRFRRCCSMTGEYNVGARYGKKEKTGVGLIGCGYATQVLHLPALRSLPRVRIAGLADIDSRRLDALADSFNVKRRHTDYRALLDDPDIDVVGICSPPQFHAEMAIAALDAGKHVFIEKPLALDIEETDRLIAHAARLPYKAMVGFNLRFHYQARQAREVIRRGLLGPVEFIRTVSSSRYRWEPNYPEYRKRRDLGGGVLMELAVHHFDLWRFLLGVEIKEISAASRSDDCDDVTAAVTARLADGTIANSVFSQSAAENNEVEVFGLNGRMRLSFYRFDGFELSPGKSYSGEIGSRLRDAMNTIKAFPRSVATIRQGGMFLDSYRIQWQSFLDSILRDEPVHCTLDDGRCASQAALAAVQSALTGRSVVIDDGMARR